MGLQSRWIPGAASIVVFRIIRILDRRAKEEYQMARKRNKKGRTKANPILEKFTTYELKRELCRRRREGGWLRWILWRLGRWA